MILDGRKFLCFFDVMKSLFMLNHFNSFWTLADHSNYAREYKSEDLFPVVFAIISTQRKLEYVDLAKRES